MNESLIFIGITPFPNGLASSNRLVTLLSELPKYGWSVEVICLASTKFPTKLNKEKKLFYRKGTHKKVKYQYTSLFVKAPKNGFLKTISGLWGIFMLPIVITSLKFRHRDGKITVLTNLTQGHYIILIKFVSLLLASKFILLKSEYPRLIRKKTKLSGLYKILIEKWIFKSIHGFAVMTKSLKVYFKPLSKSSAEFEIIPMTVDLDRFSGSFISPFDFKYIAYAGSLSSEKDGLDILLRSFLFIAPKHPEMHLVIIGDNSKSIFYKNLQIIINEEGALFSDRIHFTGHIDASCIPKYLSNASILALARPDSKQAQGGFPSKLGEYLATGKPVIVTSVGEIPNYLIHKKNAILCEPGSVSDFTTKLEWTLQNPSLHSEIGNLGKQVALKIFNSEVQGKRLNSFLKKISSK